jgi:hypothetical protein
VRSAVHIGLVLALAAMGPARADVVLPKAIAASPWLKDLRRSMLKGRELSDKQLQTLADAGEGLAAARYAKRLEARNDPAFLDDAAHYYSIAVYMGRDFALPRLISLLGRPEAEFGPARLRNLRGVLDRAARKGDAVAAAGLADLLMQDAPFGQDIPRAHELLMQAAQAGDAKAALRLALDLINGSPGQPTDPEAARAALELAMNSPDPGVKAMVMTLTRQLSGQTALADAPALEDAPALAAVSALPDAPAPAETPESPPPLTVADGSIEVLGGPPKNEFPPRPRPRPETLEGAAP